MSRTIVTLIILLLLVPVAANAQQGSLTYSEARTLFDQNRVVDAQPLLEEVVATDPNNHEAWAWLAESYRRIGMTGEAVRAASESLALDPCNSFANLVIAEATHQPARSIRSDTDSNWVHYLKAMECDSTDGNIWMSIWGETILREKWDLMRKSIRKMYETRFLTPAALAYGRWMLRALPENAILVTNGDMDTYPPLAVQESESLRQDVLIIEYGILGTRQFLRYLRTIDTVRLPFDEASLDSLFEHDEEFKDRMKVSHRVFSAWLDMAAAGELSRPIALAVTLDESIYSDIKSNLEYKGPYLLWTNSPQGGETDTTTIRESIESTVPAEFSGPWVSDRDRSPVRRAYTKYLAGNVTWMALSYCEALIAAQRDQEAKEMLDWAENFESGVVAGPQLGDWISKLRKSLDQ